MKKSIALVLSSGGARGMAQVGAIEALLENGYRISAVAGSSMGAVVGGIYAAGKLTDFKEWMCSLDKIDVFNLIDFSFSSQGFIRGERVFQELRNLVGQINIEDLKIPFAAVATDMQRQKEVVFRSGDLHQAMRASIAIPTVLRPCLIDGYEIVDGGVLNPVPVDLVERKPNDLLFVVNVNANIPYHRNTSTREQRRKEEQQYRKKVNSFKARLGSILPKNTATQKKLGFFDLLTRSFDLMQDRVTSMLLEKHQPDLVVNISREACGTFEFYRSEDMIAAGKLATQQLLAEKAEQLNTIG